MTDKGSTSEPDLHGGRVRVPRSRGAGSGFLLLLLGAWGSLIPLLGPYVHFGYTPDATWHWTVARFWLELFPGAVTALGGLLLLVGANRISTSLGGSLAAAGGAWFIIGPTLRAVLHISSVGGPIHTSTLGSALETLLLFTGLGALILLLSALALGRLSVVSVRDVRAAQRREHASDAETTHRPTPDTTTPGTPVPIASQPSDPRPTPPTGGGSTALAPDPDPDQTPRGGATRA